jgi:hypothetical protein
MRAVVPESNGRRDRTRAAGKRTAATRLFLRLRPALAGQCAEVAHGCDALVSSTASPVSLGLVPAQDAPRSFST